MLFLAFVFLFGIFVFFYPIFVILGAVLMLPETWAMILAMLMAGGLMFYLEDKIDKHNK